MGLLDAQLSFNLWNTKPFLRSFRQFQTVSLVIAPKEPVQRFRHFEK